MLSLTLSSSSTCRHGRRRLFGSLQLLHLPSSAAMTTTSTSSPPEKAHHFIVDYLISKFGFSSERAIKASSHLAHLKSIERPESFVGFMRSHGFSDAQIKKMVSCHPQCLRYNAEKTLAPKLQSLKDIGFSQSDLAHIFNLNHRFLFLHINRTLIPRLQFWQGLLGSRDRLVRLLKKNNGFLTYNIDNNVMANLSFLRTCGVSDERISMVARHDPRFIVQRPRSLVAAAHRTEKEMGVARSSGMFLWALRTLNAVSNGKFKLNLELMRGFGWSEAEFLHAFRKAPLFLVVSSKMLARKMEFLLKEVGCKPLDVARHPVLLMYSLERRLIPRHHVLNILKARGLLAREYKLATVMNHSEKVFRDKFVIPNVHKVPELQEIYLDACGKGAAL